jgi:hypothetical protein
MGGEGGGGGGEGANKVDISHSFIVNLLVVMMHYDVLHNMLYIRLYLYFVCIYYLL